MIFGIGTDIAEVHRFKPWIESGHIVERFFSSEEIFPGNIEKQKEAACRHYAARFAAKEAFSKALGTGLLGFGLKELWVEKDDAGKPFFAFNERLKDSLDKKFGGKYNIQLSISHEKEYAVAFVLIEI